MIFDFRGHGRSGGLSTLGDREINDLDVAVAYARERSTPVRVIWPEGAQRDEQHPALDFLQRARALVGEFLIDGLHEIAHGRSHRFEMAGVARKGDPRRQTPRATTT